MAKKYDYRNNKIASESCGKEGQPGSPYHCIWIGVAHFRDDLF